MLPRANGWPLRYKVGAEQLQQVEFINMMADVDRLVEAARVLAYLAVCGSRDRRVAVNSRRPGGRRGLAAGRCHDLVVFAAGTQTESVRMGTRELFAGEQVTTVPLVKQADQGDDDPVWRRRAAQQDLAGDGRPAP